MERLFTFVCADCEVAEAIVADAARIEAGDFRCDACGGPLQAFPDLEEETA